MLNFNQKIIICACFITAALLSLVLPVQAQATARWTFDGNIRNNTLAISPDETLAIVGNSDTPEILVYNLKTSIVQATLSGYVTPRNIIFSPAGDVFYVSDSSLGTILKVDTKTLKTLAHFAIGPGAFGTTISKDGMTLYVNNQAASTVTVFDLQAEQPTAVITGFAQPRQGIRLSPDGNKLYVTNFMGDKITIVDSKTYKIEGEISGFNKIRAISITADGKTLFAANSGTNNIVVVDIEERKIIKRIPVGKEPYGAALTPDGKFIYSGNLVDNSLSVISLPSMKVIATVIGLHQPRQAIIFTKDAKTAYVLNEDLSIAVIDVATNRIVRTIKR